MWNLAIIIPKTANNTENSTVNMIESIMVISNILYYLSNNKIYFNGKKSAFHFVVNVTVF